MNHQRCNQTESVQSRRTFLERFGMGLGAFALSDLMKSNLSAHQDSVDFNAPHFPAKAKRVIFLFQSGGPSQMDLFDYKPLLKEKEGTELPAEVRGTQRLTGMSASQAQFSLVGSPFKFQQHGESGAWLSEVLPHTAKVVDDLCIIKSMHTDAINHGPAVTFMQTGSQFPGRPCIGAWANYGLGSENANLPAFVVMLTKDKSGQPLASRLWGNGFLPSRYQGVQFRGGKDPVLYLGNPGDLPASHRRNMLDAMAKLEKISTQNNADPLIENSIAQYELAFRMQGSIPEATDLSQETEETFKLYGEESRNPGTFAANCLLARRLAERGVRFIQLYHQDWDHHGGVHGGIQSEAKQTDQASAALITDLKQRGMLDDTLVIWGGEFGRTNYCQGKLNPGFGRDHHPRCFSMWMAGGGIKGGMSFGETDPYGYNIVENPVHIHDLQATILALLGMDHERLTYRFQGRRFRLTDVHGHVVKEILA
ncbi:DUF1501 domain-containing protein [Planctomicrobium sp. SH668]|uniref:DUF1501 domain-containing protein n=1 Tax=Planctomicrobium sp. SH668 TaxID=3448126 RepID=UPI003F5C594A